MPEPTEPPKPTESTPDEMRSLAQALQEPAVANLMNRILDIAQASPTPSVCDNCCTVSGGGNTRQQ